MVAGGHGGHEPKVTHACELPFRVRVPPRLDSFICREPFSVYSRGMATMATMATPKLKVEKKMKGKEVG